MEGNSGQKKGECVVSLAPRSPEALGFVYIAIVTAFALIVDF